MLRFGAFFPSVGDGQGLLELASSLQQLRSQMARLLDQGLLELDCSLGRLCSPAGSDTRSHKEPGVLQGTSLVCTKKDCDKN